MRPGDNKWSCSRLAIDPETGEIKWSFQTTPNDGWDFAKYRATYIPPPGA